MQFTSNTQIYLSSIRQILAKSEYQKKLYLSYYVAPPFSRNIWAYWEKIYFHKSIWPSYPCSACQMLICKNNKYTSCKYCSQNKSALPYCDSKTHLSPGKHNPVHRRLLKGPISGSSSGSASSTVSSSRFPSDIIRPAPHYSCGTAQVLHLFTY